MCVYEWMYKPIVVVALSPFITVINQAITIITTVTTIIINNKTVIYDHPQLSICLPVCFCVSVCATYKPHHCSLYCLCDVIEMASLG